MIILTADHAGFALKEKLKKHFKKSGIAFVDDSASSLVPADDYPDYVKSASKLVLQNEENVGIFICGSGIGISIAANKIKGIRAAVAYNSKIAKLSKEHNNANVIALGGSFISLYKAKKIINAYLKAHFKQDRHIKRIEKISQLEC
ncbi:MAG: ribose 5-phosphate isomerase B [Clostridia bacterium]|nr:ribose 5-phosphate isomerase B [Clostridia bacterium]